MSGALRFFFWDWGATSASVTAAAAPSASRGSGYWPYRPLDDDYWRLWAARFSPAEAQPHATFDLQAQLTALRTRLAATSVSAADATTLSRSLADLPTPFDF